jgi:hypothetical protein
MPTTGHPPWCDSDFELTRRRIAEIFSCAELNELGGGQLHNNQPDHPRLGLRRLANKLVGILHGCLKTRTLYDEETAWGHRQNLPQPSVAA